VGGAHLAGQIEADAQLIQIATEIFFFALTRAESCLGNSEQTTSITPMAGAHLDTDGLCPQLMLPMNTIFFGHKVLLPEIWNKF
jgi:hypothetical protein